MKVEIMPFGKEERALCSSLDVAETFSKSHDKVLRDIQKLDCSKEFNIANFGDITYTDSRGRKQKACVMTRDGFTFLVMGYRGEKAAKFKEGYIKKFNQMEKRLRKKEVARIKGIGCRNMLTDALQESGENERMHGFGYSTYTNYIYKMLFGMNASALRKTRNLKKSDDLRDFLSPAELRAVSRMKALVSGLVDCGWKYDQIKAFIKQNALKAVPALTQQGR